MKTFEVVTIKQQQPTQGIVDGKPVILDRWSLSALPEGAKHGDQTELASFCIVAVPKGKPNPVKVGDVVEYELREIKTQKGEVTKANYYLQRFDSQAEADAEDAKRVVRMMNSDTAFKVRILKMQQLAALQEKIAATLPASLTSTI